MSVGAGGDVGVAWTVLPFEALPPIALYDALRLRQRVFVVEQACAYLDCDGRDPASLHLLGRARDRDRQGPLVAYARLVPAGVAFAEPSIGRVATAPEARGRGYGRALMVEAIARARQAFGPGPLRIGAQQYLERFYTELGFRTASEVYDDDGVPHIQMVLPGDAL
jgi:ElaA protein